MDQVVSSFCATHPGFYPFLVFSKPVGGWVLYWCSYPKIENKGEVVTALSDVSAGKKKRIQLEKFKSPLYARYYVEACNE